MLSGTQMLNSGFLNNLRISAVDSSNKYEEAVIVVRMFSCIHYSGLLYSFFSTVVPTCHLRLLDERIAP